MNDSKELQVYAKIMTWVYEKDGFYKDKNLWRANFAVMLQDVLGLELETDEEYIIHSSQE